MTGTSISKRARAGHALAALAAIALAALLAWGAFSHGETAGKPADGQGGAVVYQKGLPQKGKAVKGKLRKDNNMLLVLIDRHRYDAKDGTPLDGENYKLDENGHRHDAEGRWVDTEGYLRDDSGHRIDAEGRPLDDEGYVLDEYGNRVPVTCGNG